LEAVLNRLRQEKSLINTVDQPRRKPALDSSRGDLAGLPGLSMGIMVASFQHEEKVWKYQIQLKMERRCCWAEEGEMC